MLPPERRGLPAIRCWLVRDVGDVAIPKDEPLSEGVQVRLPAMRRPSRMTRPVPLLVGGAKLCRVAMLIGVGDLQWLDGGGRGRRADMSV